MNKAILVIDMPKGCYECPLVVETDVYDSCCITGTHITFHDNFKFPWCPLKPVPDKVEVFMNEWADGYNACLEDILEQ